MRSRLLPHLAGALCLCAGAAWAAFAAPPPAADPADASNGVEAQARGPVHEAYAEPTEVQPEAGPVIPQQPPDPVAETPPDQKPEGNVVWIPGYWGWESDASNFVWVSGFWRDPPPNRDWTPGHWQQVDGGWQWSPGFWVAQDAQQVEYLPPPPPSIDSGPSTPAPDEDSSYVAGCWVYRESRYFWRPGYWVAFNPDWCWIPDHYCWTPAGCVFVAGYWDYPLGSRGLLFAPVRFEADVLARRGFTYVPEYVVQPDFLLTALFVRPAYGHYYFGDYFEDRYEREGFTPWVDYRIGKHAIDPNFAFYSRRFKGEGRWGQTLRDFYAARRSGDAPRPPRTWAQQTQEMNKFTTNRTGNVAINAKINLTNLEAVTALTPLNKADGMRPTGLAAITGPRAREGKAPPAAPAMKLETLSKERRTEVQQRVKDFHDFTATQQRDQAQVLTDGVPVKPTDAPKAVKVQVPKMPARPQEPRTEQKPPAPAPPPPPPAPKHEERPIPQHEPPKPAAPPKNPPTTPKEPPATPPKAPPTTSPKEPPATPPTPPKKPPTPPRREPPTPPPTPEPPRREPPATPPKEPPTPPPTPREPPAPTPPKEPPAPKEPPPAPPRREPPAPPPTPPREPPAPPPAPPAPPAHQPPPAPPAPPAPPPAPPHKDKDKPPEVFFGV